MPAFYPVLKLPENPRVFDFTGGRIDESEVLAAGAGIGRYGEKRPGIYSAAHYGKGAQARDIHVGIDLFAPVETAVYAFADGEVYCSLYNDRELDYGYTLITRHRVDLGRGLEAIYALHGHLGAKSIQGKNAGQKISRGEIIAWVGDRHENGGWLPHLHFQLSRVEPVACDLPGAVSAGDFERAQEIYPDPRAVLGPIY